jgi:hypothetical protein
MAIEDINELKQVNGQAQAQRLLDEGWRILAVCVMQDGSSQYAEYHLGRAKPKGMPEQVGMLGAHVQFQTDVKP